MVQDPQMAKLIARWESAREAGKSLSPDELCADCPDLVPALRSALVRMQGSNYDETASRQKSGDTSDPWVTDLPVAPRVDVFAERDRVSSDDVFRVGQEVIGFRLIRQIGQGGFGQVFEAEDLKLTRPVAIKFLLPHTGSCPEIREQFLTEARSMAAIQHDHVVPIFQVGQVDAKLFLVMPLLVGETLAQRLKREGSLPPSEVRRIGRELCLGLSALHAKGLIHRDIKPANVWLEMTTGRVKLLDLGLADAAINLETISSVGTPAYMSPDQVDGHNLDFRSDLFSVGALLYECSTGRRAFVGHRVKEVLEAVKHTQPMPIREINPGVPFELADFINRLLTKEREERPASALEVAEKLNSNNGPVSAVSSSSAVLSRKLLLVFGVVAICGFVASLISYQFLKPPVAPADASAERSTEPTTKSSTLVTLTVNSLQVIPWKIEGDRLKEALPPLGERDYSLPTANDAIEVTAKLSRPSYSFIILYRSDGQDYLLFPQDDTSIPPLTEEPRYPSIRPDVRYVLDDGPGIWAVAVLASDKPLPSYRDWLEQRSTKQPWKPQPDPTRLQLALLDTGKQWRTLGNNRSYSRGERQFQVEPYRQQMDWLKRQVGEGAVMGVAFPVRSN